MLADFLPLYEGALEVLKVLRHSKISKSQYREIYDVPVVKIYQSLGIDKKNFEDKAELLAHTFHEFYEPRASKCRTRAGTRRVLEYLSANSIKSIILSNHTSQGIQAQLKRLKLERYFDDVLANTSQHAAHLSGKQRRLLKYLAQHNFKPSECLIVGDSAEEVIIGKDLMIKTVAITEGAFSLKRLKAESPDYIITNLEQLFTILKTK